MTRSSRSALRQAFREPRTHVGVTQHGSRILLFFTSHTHGVSSKPKYEVSTPQIGE